MKTVNSVYHMYSFVMWDLNSHGNSDFNIYVYNYMSALSKLDLMESKKTDFTVDPHMVGPPQLYSCI